MTVSEWADSERYLSSESSAEPGKWYTDRAPFLRGIMDAFNDPAIHTVVLMKSAQVGGTEAILNIIGYLVDKDPSPILWVMPTLEMAEGYSKERFMPMVRDTPALSAKIGDKARDGNNTIRNKSFYGGHIAMVGANSPGSLRGRPIRVVLLDEVDAYPASAGEEGDPANLATKRTTTFWNRKIVMVSTPGIKGESRIEAAYLASDQRVYEVHCPHCDAPHVMRFSHMQRPHDDAKPEEWAYHCPECGAAIPESQKMEMLRRGEWRAQKPFRGVAGFWINEMYSPWVAWEEIVSNFMEAKKLPDTLKTFVNTSLAETWNKEEEGDGLEVDKVAGRVEEYPAQVPGSVYLLTAAVDTQDDRLEVEVLGWGENQETWSIRHDVLYGDPAAAETWQKLDDILLADYRHELGITMRISMSLVDVGGHHSEAVYRYIKRHGARGRNIFGVRGHSVRGMPILAKPKPSINNDYRVRVFYAGTDTAKELIYSYLRLESPGAGYMHHPADYDESYFAQLTAEKKVSKYEKGRPVTKWVCPQGKRNEALDLKVYNFVAYRILKPDMTAWKNRILAKAAQVGGLHKAAREPDNNLESLQPPPKPRPVRRKRQGSFVKTW